MLKFCCFFLAKCTTLGQKCKLLISVFLFSAHQPLPTLAKACKILQGSRAILLLGKIDLAPAILNYALNFSSNITKVDQKDFQIIYQYLRDNVEEQLGPFVFKNTLMPNSDISKLAHTLHEQLADNFEIRCGFSDVEQSIAANRQQLLYCQNPEGSTPPLLPRSPCPWIEISIYKRVTLVEGLKNALSVSNSTNSNLEMKNIADLLNMIKEES